MNKPFNLQEVALGVAAILFCALAAWWLLKRAAQQTARRFDALLAAAKESVDAQYDVAAVRRRMTALRLVVNAGKYALALSALLMVLRWLKVPLDSLLLPAGFLGAALGLGAQNLVRDVVAGLFIVFEGQFAVGDIVSINGTVGTVDEIGLRVTRLRDEAAHLYFIPNGAINAVEKYPRRHVPLVLCVPLDEPAPDEPERARAAAEQAAEIVLRAIQRFGADYDALVGAAVQIEAPVEGWRTRSRSGGAADETNRRREEKEGVAAVLRSASALFSELGGEDATALREDERKREADEERDREERAHGEKPAPGSLCFRLPVRPLRAALVRDKLPARVTAALEAAGAKMMAGAEVGIFNAPATESSVW